MARGSKSNGKVARRIDDLAEFDAMQQAQEAGIAVDIKDPSGASLGFSITVAGPDSEVQRKIVEELTDERLNSDDPAPLTAADIADRKLRALAMSTLRWGEFKLDGGIYAFSTDNALKLYTRFPFIRDQIEEKAGRRSAFLALSRQVAAAPSGDGSTGSEPASRPLAD